MPDTPPSTTSEHNAQPPYRPDIDGLRAFAIISVVLFHVFPTTLRGGFVGVDIFFVISGFLISSIIFRSLHRGDFSFAEFYAHRARRIFPALIVVLLAAYVFGWFSLLPDELKQLAKHMAAGAGFVLNFVLWKEAGYFDTASELKPLMHLWSLAIEEQFYLFYPFLIWGVWRLGLNVLSVVALVGLLSFGLNVTGIEKDAVRTFFLPQTRLWELLAGCVLAYTQLFKRVQLAEWLKRIAFHPVFFRQPPLAVHRDAVLNSMLSACGLLLLVASVAGLHKGKLFPGWWAVLPVLGAFLIILAGPEAWANRKILANRPMVFVGLISYPLYLWHWPILAYARIVESDAPSLKVRIGVVAMSFLLAGLTYRFIEKPIRFGPRNWRRTAGVCLLVALVGLLGVSAWKHNGFPSRINLAMSEEELNSERMGYWYETDGLPFSDDKTNVIVYGDSQSHDIFQALKNDPTIGLKRFGALHLCSAFFSANFGEEKLQKYCEQAFDKLLESKELQQADVLIYSHFWAPGAAVQENYRKGLERILQKNQRIKVYFFGQKQALGPKWVSINVITKDYKNLIGMNDFLKSKVMPGDTSPYVQALSNELGVTFVDVRKIFCMDECVYFADGKHSYFDQIHWTHVGAQRFFDRLSRTEVYRQLARYKR